MNIELRILDKEFYYNKLVNSDTGQLQTDHNIEICALPHYATPGSVGMDLHATKDYVIAPQERVKIGTGIAIHIGSYKKEKQTIGVEYFASPYAGSLALMGMIVPRSGLGTKGLVLANTLGIIDEDYQGEIVISAWNSLPFSMEPYDNIEVKAGHRIAQLIFMPVIKSQWTVVDEFTQSTDRGQGSFGSSGK